MLLAAELGGLEALLGLGKLGQPSLFSGRLERGGVQSGVQGCRGHCSREIER